MAYLGVRASYFHVDNRVERGRNSYDLHVARVSDSRFERLVLLDVPRADAPTRLQWKVNKVGVPVDELPQAGETLRMHFDASKIHLGLSIAPGNAVGDISLGGFVLPFAE